MPPAKSLRSLFFPLLLSALLGALPAAPASAAICGQPISDGQTPTASDALYVLSAALGLSPCTLAACDVTSDCAITAADALPTLVSAIGGSASLGCDAACVPSTPCEQDGAPVCNGTCPAEQACTSGNAAVFEPDLRITICDIGGGTAPDATLTVTLDELPSRLSDGDSLGPCDGGASIGADDPSAGFAGASAEAGALAAAYAIVTTATAGGARPATNINGCVCAPFDVPTTTTTSTSTTNTLPPPPVDDQDNDGLLDFEDPCPVQPRNQCFGTVAVDQTTETPIRINADAAVPDDCSGDRVDCNGDTWFADFGFSSREAGAACDIGPDGFDCEIRGVDAIFGCDDANTQDIFQCEHFDRAPGAELSYSFDVPDGEYLVNFLFANTFERTRIAGARVFDVMIEGEIAIDDFDQVAEAGGSRNALVRSRPVTVDDGNGMTIEFIHVIENPTVKGIEVLSAQ